MQTLSILRTKQDADSAPNAALDRSAREALGAQVMTALSGSYVLMLKTQAVHWNIAGPLFKPVHDLTEEQYTDLFAAIDDLAERLRALGLKAPMNYSALQGNTALAPFGDTVPSAGEMIGALASDHEALTRDLIAGIEAAAKTGDPATEDLLTERLRIHQKHAWMLRAMLEG